VTAELAQVAPPALGAVGLTVRFGGVVALSDVDLHVPAASIVGLVGPNGAGKSTAFAVLSGLLAPNGGRVMLGGVDVTSASPQSRARRGLARTFQQPELFTGLSVREHILLADRMCHHRSRAWRDAFTAGALRRGSRVEDERITRLLDLLGIADVASRQVGGLPLGTSRLVEVARALATDPTVLLLDEPMSGLSDRESDALGDTLTQVVEERGTSVVLVEHDVPMVLRLCSTIFVLDFGEVIASGTPEQIRADPAVQTAYLGETGL
jgi:ABC-type branched-subunit amino acid transport system ATPase component